MDKLKITSLLEQWRSGDTQAFNHLIDGTYDELKKIAHWRLVDEFRGSGWRTTELLDEVVILLMGKRSIEWENRRHFYHVAGLAMHRLLIDEARKRQTPRHGGHLSKITLQDEHRALSLDWEQLLELDAALKTLEEEDPLLVKIVKLRYFAGYTIKETAEILDLPTIKVNRKWAFAKALLQERLT